MIPWRRGFQPCARALASLATSAGRQPRLRRASVRIRVRRWHCPVGPHRRTTAMATQTAGAPARDGRRSAYDREREERLVQYARIDTQSDESSTTSPSTAKQFDLLHPLRDELVSLGAQDVVLTGYGALLATIPATTAFDAPVIALLAHVDTAPQFNATGVKPIVHRNYDGRPIVLPDDPEIVLSPDVF